MMEMCGNWINQKLNTDLIHLYALHRFMIFLMCFKIEKLRKQSLFENVRWNKTNDIPRIWIEVFDLSNFPHMSHTHTYIYIYIYIYISPVMKNEKNMKY